jgi:hypothetical protein|tara:strand:- start:2916 stop:3743 length:828 start_codon:yes stop_codon:yes gene_type:complete
MSKVRLTGSNSGYVEIAAFADAGNLSFTMPTSGTALVGNGNNVYTGITTFNNDVTFDGATAGYDVVWDRSDNQLEFATNAKASFGNAMQIYHDGNNSLIQDSGTGHVQVRSGTFTVGNAGLTKTSAIFNSGSGQQLNFNNNQKFITTNTGVVVSGICTATSFSGDGSNLTGLNVDATALKDGSGNVIVQASATAVSVTAGKHVNPASTNTTDLGTTSLRWRNLYTQDLQLSNESSSGNDVDGTWGNYTIQEGESDLFLINNRSGKKYKFLLQEVT